MSDCPSAESSGWTRGHVSDIELLPKSKPEPVRRVEVFTGTGRRRAWAAGQEARENRGEADILRSLIDRIELTPNQQGKLDITSMAILLEFSVLPEKRTGHSIRATRPSSRLRWLRARNHLNLLFDAPRLEVQ